MSEPLQSSYLEMLRVHVDEGGQLSHLNGLDLLAEVERLRSIPAQPDPAAQFVMWALTEGSWQGTELDGGAIQDKAVELGLIIEDQYDPKRHPESDCVRPGDPWFIPSEALLSSLTSTDGWMQQEWDEMSKGVYIDAVREAIMGAARLYTHDHTTAYKITEMAMSAISALPSTERKTS